MLILNASAVSHSLCREKGNCGETAGSGAGWVHSFDLESRGSSSEVKRRADVSLMVLLAIARF